jgi:hypothetical protein
MKYAILSLAVGLAAVAVPAVSFALEYPAASLCQSLYEYDAKNADDSTFTAKPPLFSTEDFEGLIGGPLNLVKIEIGRYYITGQYRKASNEVDCQELDARKYNFSQEDNFAPEDNSYYTVHVTYSVTSTGSDYTLTLKK